MSHVKPHVLGGVVLPAMWAVAGLVVWSAWAPAQGPHPTPFGQRLVLMQAVRGNWMQFNIISGRIQVSSSQPITVANGSERLNIRPDGNQSSVDYDATQPEETFHFDVKEGNRIHVRRESRGKTPMTVDFLQTPAQLLVLTLVVAGKTTVYRAEGLWHLLLAEPEVCRQQLAPMLDLLRPDWRLAERAAQIEDELVQSAASGQFSDRRRWDELVRQLADDRFSRREAADRELRAAGPAVMPYLQRLDFTRLEAEQQARVRRILAELIQDIDDDTVTQVAVGLATEPAVWLAMLSRPEERTRRLAAAQLARLLGETLDFDPVAAPAVRQAQIERLRARVLPR
jgi:hypothetical protein